MKVTAAIVGALLLSSCAWSHPTKNASDWDREYYECEREAAPQQDPILWRGMVERCMRIKGWRQE